MSYTVEQSGETQRLEAILSELRPIEARCVELSSEMLKCIQRAKALEEKKYDNAD
jgi:hypothetical protein